jgi:hypothetical protein
MKTSVTSVICPAGSDDRLRDAASPELLVELKTHKPAIVQALRVQWLAGVADLLACSPAYLLARGFIDHHDLAEQYAVPPGCAARLICSHPQWAAPPSAFSHPNHSMSPHLFYLVARQ